MPLSWRPVFGDLRDCWAEERRYGAEGGDCADPEARAGEIISNPRLRGDAGEYADVDDRFGCDQPIEAAVEELEKSSAPHLLTLLRFDWE